MKFRNAALGLAFIAPVAIAAPQFVNSLTLDGAAVDRTGGTGPNDGRIGYFSDLHYDAKRKQWWALSDRGPGGGLLHYEPRVQRFKLDVDADTGAISGFKVVETVIFRDEAGNPLDGLAPYPTDVLGGAFDPEGFAMHPKTGQFFVSDEYGPSLYEFSREGVRQRVFETPANLLPRNRASGAPNYAGDAGNDAGKRSNRGFEGLAITPDGAHLYAILQSAMLDEGGGNGRCGRIVKFDTTTGQAVAQYAYEMDGSSQGRGVSALLALNDHEFLVLERDNRGVGIGASIATPGNKKVFRIDLAGATDVSDVPFSTTAGAACPAGKVAKIAAPFIDIGASGGGVLGGKVPEKWEGLVVGPRLADGGYVVVAGTDNDYSVTQTGAGTQYDVYLRFSDADPYAASIQCPLGATTGCTWTASGLSVELPGDGSYVLLPGVLAAWKASAADLAGYQPATPPLK